MMTMSLLKQKKAVKQGPKVRSEEGLLSIDCRMCAGPSSLGDVTCVKCITNTIEENGAPARLMIRKDADTEYSENVIAVLSEISKIGSLTRTAFSEKLASKCKGCPSSIPKNAKEIWDSFPEPRFDIMRLEVERSGPKKDGCEECVWKTIGFIDRVEKMFSDLRTNAAKKAFRLSEV